MWVFPNNLPNQAISDDEKKWEKSLSKNAFDSYKYSRGYLRLCLSEIFNIDPLEVPLKSDPREAPLLGFNNGYVSISHTSDKLFLAWAPNNIGIDIEQKLRSFKAKKLVERFFSELEKKELRRYKKSDYFLFQQEVLRYWIIKESAYKWQSKKEPSDFFHWESIKNLEIAVNSKKQLKVKTYIRSYGNSYLGIAYNSK